MPITYFHCLDRRVAIDTNIKELVLFNILAVSAVLGKHKHITDKHDKMNVHFLDCHENVTVVSAS